MEVLVAVGTRLAWSCADCGHGSAEPRDQAAHLDAHRQLGQFLREWDAAVAPVARKRPSRLLAVMCGAVLVVTAGAGVSAFSSLQRDWGPPPPAPPAIPAPGVHLPGYAPAPALPVGTPVVADRTATPTPKPGRSTPAPALPVGTPVVADRTATPTTTPKPGRSTPAPLTTSSSSPAPSAPTPVSPKAMPAPAASSPPASPAAAPTIAQAAPPAHLLNVCLLGICVTAL